MPRSQGEDTSLYRRRIWDVNKMGGILITEKNRHLQDWRWVNGYPYNERWILEEEIRNSRKGVRECQNIEKKPVIIEAERFVEGFYNNPEIPNEFKEVCCRKNDTGSTFLRPHIHTLEGIYWITLNDWIVKGVRGEFYPVKPDIFEATYEKVELI